MKPRKPKLKSRFCKHSSSLKKRPVIRKPERSPSNPVKVVFVCSFGGSSYRNSNKVNSILRENKLNSIKSSNCSLNDLEKKNLGWRDYFNALKDADIIFQPFVTSLDSPHPSIEILKKYAKKEALIVRTADYCRWTSDGTKLLKLIKDHFVLKET